MAGMANDNSQKKPKGNSSANHHWWPVALQSYWPDKNGDVSWIDPDGAINKKRSRNRKIGVKRHGHTLFRGQIGGWGETNFEGEFDIDDEVHNIIERLDALKPLGNTVPEFFSLLRLFLKKERSLSDLCKFYHIQDQDSRQLLLLIYSLLIRSPSTRFKFENFPTRFGLPQNEEIGKANMRQNYLLAKKLCEHGMMTNRFFVVLHSPSRRFICGDGYLDWLSGGVTANRVSGRALLPLTPHICVYICTPIFMRTTRNCAALRAPGWMVDQVNEITQIYSRDRLFFRGRAPRLTDHFRKRQFLEHSNYTVNLLDMFDEIARPKSH